MNYKVWKVIEQTKLGERVKFYVVNQLAPRNKVQSVWKSFLEAQAVCDNLNRITAKVA